MLEKRCKEKKESFEASDIEFIEIDAGDVISVSGEHREVGILLPRDDWE